LIETKQRLDSSTTTRGTRALLNSIKMHPYFAGLNTVERQEEKEKHNLNQ
jgi:hypothetical protein